METAIDGGPESVFACSSSCPGFRLTDVSDFSTNSTIAAQVAVG